jgi:hypothetical protein
MKEMLWYWVITGAAVLVILFIIGIMVNGRFFGVLIDSRCKMSLSRFQLSLWTWLLVSSFFAIAWTRKTMNIDMAPEIWALMGISVGSAAGAVMIKGTKEAKEPDSSKVGRAAIDQNRLGLLQTNLNPKDASFSDMFKGEELTDSAYVDISKVQMFFFTIAALIGYARVLWMTTISPDAEGVIMFPMLSTSIVTLIGISHAGYLTVKSAPKTPST